MSARGAAQPATDFDAIDREDFSEEVPKSEFSFIRHLISQIKPGMSLARVTLPTFILERRSTLERLTDWMVHADILRLVTDDDDRIMRAPHFCTWMVAGFHMAPRTPKKPYNSLLGECFRAALSGPNGSITGTYVAEQVSHHPPICAFHYEDRRGGVVVWGHSELRSKFLLHSIAAIMDNENTRVNFEAITRGETYQFNLPNMYGRGVLTGKLTMEICGKVRVSCAQTGVFAKIEFLEKPTFGRGRYNCFKGIVYTEERVKKKMKRVVHISFSGRWSAFMRCKDERNGRQWLSFDVRTADAATIIVPEMAEQASCESRFVWQMVTHHLAAGNVKKATDHKLALEEKQRALVKQMKATKNDWVAQSFHWDDAQKRYVPNGLNLAKWTEGDPPPAMPPPFVLPKLIEDLEVAGVTKTFAQLHREVEGLPPGAITAPLINVDVPEDDPDTAAEIVVPESPAEVDALVGAASSTSDSEWPNEVPVADASSDAVSDGSGAGVETLSGAAPSPPAEVPVEVAAATPGDASPNMEDPNKPLNS
jgi:hypothetical protein